MRELSEEPGEVVDVVCGLRQPCVVRRVQGSNQHRGRGCISMAHAIEHRGESRAGRRGMAKYRRATWAARERCSGRGVRLRKREGQRADCRSVQHLLQHSTLTGGRVVLAAGGARSGWWWWWEDEEEGRLEMASVQLATRGGDGIFFSLRLSQSVWRLFAVWCVERAAAKPGEPCGSGRDQNGCCALIGSQLCVVG